MDKIWLIIQREFTMRVYSKKFWLVTFLGPLSILLLYAFLGFIMVNKGDNTIHVAIKDTSNLLGKIPDTQDIYYHFKPSSSKEKLLEELEAEEYDAVIVLPDSISPKHTKYTFEYTSRKTLSLDHELSISKIIGKRIREYKIKAYGINQKELEALDTDIALKPKILGKDEEVSSLTSAIGSGFSFIIAMAMYMIIFFFGMMVMRSVMEEKINRIVEVMISTVKPFHLMMGKIIGVAGAGVVQIISLAILMPIVYFFGSMFFASTMDFSMDVSQMEAQGIDPDEMQYQIALAIDSISNFNWIYILVIILLYFIGGFFLYASLFAAIGSATGDDQGESQQLTLPVAIPIIIALYISIAIATSPDSGLAVWSSMVPFFSPIVMCTRLFSEPPLWQILVSLGLLYGTAVFVVWLSSRIYRVGILLYGKKVSFPELIRWIFK